VHKAAQSGELCRYIDKIYERLIKGIYMKLQIDILKPKKNKCWLFHKWITEKEEDVTIYQRCKRCKSKRIIQNSKYYQKVDLDYLKI